MCESIFRINKTENENSVAKLHHHNVHITGEDQFSVIHVYKRIWIGLHGGANKRKKKKKEKWKTDYVLEELLRIYIQVSFKVM